MYDYQTGPDTGLGMIPILILVGVYFYFAFAQFKIAQKIGLTDANPAVNGPSDDVLALDEALARLAEMDKTKADLVKLRYFAGLTLEQAAAALNLPERTAKRAESLTKGLDFFLGREEQTA